MFAADTWERVVFHDSWHRFLHHASLAAYHASQASAKQVEDRALLKIAAAFYDEMFAPDQPAITPIPVGMRFLGSAQFCCRRITSLHLSISDVLACNMPCDALRQIDFFMQANIEAPA